MAEHGIRLFCFKSSGSVAWSFAVAADSETNARAAVDAFLESEGLNPVDIGDYEIYGWPERYTMSVCVVGQVAHFSTRSEHDG